MSIPGHRQRLKEAEGRQGGRGEGGNSDTVQRRAVRGKRRAAQRRAVYGEGQGSGGVGTVEEGGGAGTMTLSSGARCGAAVEYTRSRLLIPVPSQLG